MLLETKGKGTLIYSMRNLSRIVPAIMLTAEFISDEYRYIKEETSKYILEVSAQFLLLVVKCERHKLKEELLNEKEAGLNNLENS